MSGLFDSDGKSDFIGRLKNIYVHIWIYLNLDKIHLFKNILAAKKDDVILKGRSNSDTISIFFSTDHFCPISVNVKQIVSEPKCRLKRWPTYFIKAHIRIYTISNTHAHTRAHSYIYTYFLLQ